MTLDTAERKSSEWFQHSGEKTQQTYLKEHPHSSYQVAYHGTGTPGFEKFRVNPDDYMPDCALGVHVAKDPAVSETFVKTVPGQGWGAKDEKQGGIYPLHIPTDDKFYTLRQDLLPYIDKNTPKTPKNVENDQTAVQREMARVAFRKDPDMFTRYLRDRWRMEPHEAEQAAKDILDSKPHKNPMLSSREINGLDDYIKADGVATPTNKEDKQRFAKLFKEHLQGQGYKGVKYINTSAKETAHAKDPTSYIVFDPKDIKSKYTGADMGKFFADIAAAYERYVYTGGKGAWIGTKKRGKDVSYILRKGDKFGVKPSAKGSSWGAIVVDKLPAVVFDIPQATLRRILLSAKADKPADQPKTAMPMHLVQMQPVWKKLKPLGTENRLAQAPWIALAKWANIHNGVNVSAGDLYLTAEYVDEGIDETKKGLLKDLKPYIMQLHRGIKTMKSLFNTKLTRAQCIALGLYIRNPQQAPAATTKTLMRAHDARWKPAKNGYIRGR
jgi:hypothetical protein